jgi:hypothetical protein
MCAADSHHKAVSLFGMGMFSGKSPVRTLDKAKDFEYYKKIEARR